jgi:hypothetical protein
MQYAMPGISGAEAAARQQEIAAFVYDALTGRNMEQLVPSVRVFDAPEGLTAAGVDMFLGAQRSGGVPVAASAAGDFAVTVFGSGREEYVSYIMDLVPPQSRAAMQEILEIVREGRGITKLNDLYEVLQRTDPALYENFISIMERPETIEGLMRIMPAEAAENLRHLSEMPF